MRHLATALVALLLASLGTVAPTAHAVPAGAVTSPKVAIIVGATHSATDRYRQHAEELYAEAIQLTPNVVRVYSPNATWSAVRSAVNGASIIVYLGHGNGWPSPYAYDPAYTTKNGFGLNAAAGMGDDNNRYYGEPYIETLTPAPNAVVLLFHLCYAAGNSEPGQTPASLSVARQRVDNYASAFLRAGARAVIADGHSHDPYYLRALFSGGQTLDQLWRAAPNANGNVLTYPSSRSPGFAYQLDPDTPTEGYYRALSGNLALRTEDVTGAPILPGAPAPGEVDLAPPALTLSVPEGSPIALSPNGDGVADTMSLDVQLGEPGTVEAVVSASGAPVALRTLNAPAGHATLTWDGAADSGGVVPDGQYQLEVRARDLAGNVALPATRPLTVYAPLGAITLDAPRFFPHDGDALRATSEATFTLRSYATVGVEILDASGAAVRTLVPPTPTGPGPMVVTWDGRNDLGALVARGTYRFRATATDGVLSDRQVKAVFADAFRIVPSDRTPARGQRITITATASETLVGSPRLTIRQPGRAAWGVSMTRIAAGVYRATIILKSGSRGTVRFVVSGTDTGGGRQSSTLSLPIH